MDCHYLLVQDNTFGHLLLHILRFLVPMRPTGIVNVLTTDTAGLIKHPASWEMIISVIMETLTYSNTNVYYSNNHQWDGQGCGPNSTCCQFNNPPPWFYKELPQATNDNIESRLCLHSHIYRTFSDVISIGNHMDESAIWEKIAWQQKNCTRRRAECYLNCCKCNFFPKFALSPM